jgi:hypothetical protein
VTVLDQALLVLVGEDSVGLMGESQRFGLLGVSFKKKPKKEIRVLPKKQNNNTSGRRSRVWQDAP